VTLAGRRTQQAVWEIRASHIKYTRSIRNVQRPALSLMSLVHLTERCQADQEDATDSHA